MGFQGQYFSPAPGDRRDSNPNQRCRCGAIYMDHYNGSCPCDECGRVHEGRRCPLDLTGVKGCSKFQLEAIQSINARDEFDKFVTIDNDLVKTFSKPNSGLCAFDVLWWDKDAELHRTRIGVAKILKEEAGVGHAT